MKLLVAKANIIQATKLLVTLTIPIPASESFSFCPSTIMLTIFPMNPVMVLNVKNLENSPISHPNCDLPNR